MRRRRTPSKRSRSRSVHIDPIAFDHISCCATLKMNPGDTHMRHVAFYLPRFSACPSVSARIVGGPDASPLVISSLKINDGVRTGKTQIAIEAQTISGTAFGVHHCNIVVIGAPLVHSQRRGETRKKRKTG